MKNSILVLLFMFLSGSFLAQQDTIPTIKISKSKTKLFKGESTETLNWYFYIDEENYCYLANLDIPLTQINAWFEQRKNSENLFKSTQQIENNSSIFLVKKNEPDVVLEFNLTFEVNNVKLKSTIDQTIYIFSKINIQE